MSVREGSIWNGRSISISRARTKREVEFWRVACQFFDDSGIIVYDSALLSRLCSHGLLACKLVTQVSKVVIY